MSAHAARVLRRAAREAVEQSRLAYQFAPNSYTSSCHQAALSVVEALDVIDAADTGSPVHVAPGCRSDALGMPSGGLNQ